MQIGVLIQHCCMINHVQNQSPVTKISGMQTSSFHPSPAARSGTKVVSAPTEYKAGETAIEQLLAEEESARAKTASKKAKRQRQQQKKRTQSSHSKAGQADPPVQPEPIDHYSTSDTLPSPVTDTGQLQADSETCQSSSPPQPGSMQTGSSTDNSRSRSAHMTVSTSACMSSMSKASPDQVAPEVLDERAPQGCSEEPLNSQKHPSQPLQDTACLQSLAQADSRAHPYDVVGTPQPHAINSQWRPTGLQEAVTSHQAESSSKQVPAAVDTHAIETAYQAAGLPDITAQIPEHAEHFLGSLFCCPLTKVILYLAACVMPTCTCLQQKS